MSENTVTPVTPDSTIPAPAEEKKSFDLKKAAKWAGISIAGVCTTVVVYAGVKHLTSSEDQDMFEPLTEALSLDEA